MRCSDETSIFSQLFVSRFEVASFVKGLAALRNGAGELLFTWAEAGLVIVWEDVGIGLLGPQP